MAGLALGGTTRDNRGCRARFFGRERRGASSGSEEQRDPRANEISRERRQLFIPTFRAAECDDAVVSPRQNPLRRARGGTPQRGAWIPWASAAAEKPDHRHRGLLRARRKRPHRSRAAERG